MAERAHSDAGLDALRQRIDALDRELLALLNRRAAVAQQVGALKRRDGSAAFRPEREAQVIAGLEAANEGPLMIMSTVPSVMPWLMSVSLPSEEAGNTWMSNLPLVRFLISCAAHTDSVWYGSLVS